MLFSCTFFRLKMQGYILNMQTPKSCHDYLEQCSRISLSAAGVWNNFWRTSPDSSSAVKHFDRSKTHTDVANTISISVATQAHVQPSCDSLFHLQKLPLFAKVAGPRNLKRGLTTTITNTRSDGFKWICLLYSDNKANWEITETTNYLDMNLFVPTSA